MNPICDYPDCTDPAHRRVDATNGDKAAEAPGPKWLVLTWSSNHTIRTMVRNGIDGVSYAVEEAVRYLHGSPDIDPNSIHFRIERD